MYYIVASMVRAAWLIPKIADCAEEISVKADKTGKKSRDRARLKES